VPADAYYGIQTPRGAENFPITAYRIHPTLIRAMGFVKNAAALANRDTTRLEPKIADAIAHAAGDVIAAKLDDQFIVDPIQGGAGTSINMNANKVIANRAPGAAA
jgi:aspartate ammonia-lyase